MGRIIACLLTAVLAVCFVILLAPKSGIPRGFAVSTLVDIGLLWLVVLRPGMPLWLKAFLLIAISCLTLVAIIFAAALGVADRPKRESAGLLGEGSTGGPIAIVYHPGGTSFTRQTALRLGQALATKGHAVRILTAHPELRLNQAEFKAIILGSPVYAGEARPPLKDFVAANAPFTIPVFALLTGGGSSPEKDDLRRLTDSLAKHGVTMRGGVKILSQGGPAEGAGEAKIDAFAETVDRATRTTQP